MTLLALDPSALVHRWVAGTHHRFVVEAMAAADTWAVSGLARTEVLVALHRMAGDPWTAAELTAAAHLDLDAMVTVPVDDRCLAHAVELGRRFGLRTVDAVHLAALDRLPRPARYATLDRHQIPAAVALGLEVVTPVEP